VEGAEIYALKIAQLLLPTDGHRWSVLRELKETYNRSAPLRNENTSASLGVVASIGFLFLVGRYLYRRPLSTQAVPIDCLSLLTLAAVLLGTIGGFGALFGLLFPWVRAYNRISIYIGFFALFAVAGLIGWAYRLCDKRPYLRRAMAGLLLVLLGVGVLDEVPRYDTLIDPASPTTFAADQAFVQEIEATLPAGAMVFQVPYMPFPESRPVHGMEDYEHLRGYLHSDQLRWSYGVMRGTEGDARYRALATLPPEEMVRCVAQAGYRGIYLDRAGYSDGGSQLESVLTQLLDVPPLTSDKGRFAFYNLTRYAEGLRQQVARVGKEKDSTNRSLP
jgi:phosphoglycerol transferase